MSLQRFFGKLKTLNWINFLLLKRFASPNVRDGVDWPCNVEGENVTEQVVMISDGESFAVEVAR